MKCRCGNEDAFKVCTMDGADWMCSECFTRITEEVSWK